LWWWGSSKRYDFSKFGLSHEDLAYDIVADLLAERDGLCCAQLCDALRDVSPGSDEELLSTFESVLFGNAIQSVQKVFREVNRTQYLLLRSLRNYVGTCRDIQVVDRLDGRWYVFVDDEDSLLQCPAIPRDELHRVLRTRTSGQSSLAIRVVREAREVLMSQDIYRRAVSEADILSIAVNLVEMNLVVQSEIDLVPERTVELSKLWSVICRVLKDVGLWVEEMYVLKGRLNADEADAMMAAARAWFEDRLMGEEQSLYAYLRNQMPGLTQVRYRKHYRHQFEYVLKKIQRRTGDILRSEEPESSELRNLF